MADNLIDKSLDEIAKIRGLGQRRGRRGGRGGPSGRGGNSAAAANGRGGSFRGGFGRRQNGLGGAVQKRRSGGALNASFSPTKANAAVCY